MKRLLIGIVMCVAVGLPTAATAQWTLDTNVNPTTGEQAVFISRPATFAGAIAFVCVNSALLAPSYVLLRPSNYSSPLRRVDVTTILGDKPPIVGEWSFTLRDGQLRSQDVVIADLFAGLEGERTLAFEVADTFLRIYRVEALVDNLLELAPDFLAQCAALPPMQRGP